MSINSPLVKVGHIEATVVRKNVKNLHLSVLPPQGRVRITAPLDTKDDQIRVFLTTKLAWIRKQQEQFIKQRRQTKRRYVSGETYYYLGRPYRLRVDKTINKAGLQLSGNETMILRVESDATIQKKEQIMTEWFRRKFKELLATLIPKWQKKLKIQSQEWRIQRMKTRWGTCNAESGRILLNLELIKKPVECIEYVLVHEWLHLIEPKYNDNFTRLLTKHYPKWRHAREELNRFILTYEEWETKTY